jgi:hypothetical protein
MTTPERWLPVPGASKYLISSHGRVLSFRVSKHGRAVSYGPNNKGYAFVNVITDEGRTKSHQVHRLVAHLFLKKSSSNLTIVRHLDSDRMNPHVDNLIWGTDSENVRDSVRAGVHGQARKTHCPQGHPYSGDNLIKRPTGRFCRQCSKDASARFRQRQKLRG